MLPSRRSRHTRHYPRGHRHQSKAKHQGWVLVSMLPYFVTVMIEGKESKLKLIAVLFREKCTCICINNPYILIYCSNWPGKSRFSTLVWLRYSFIYSTMNIVNITGNINKIYTKLYIKHSFYLFPTISAAYEFSLS